MQRRGKAQFIRKRKINQQITKLELTTIIVFKINMETVIIHVFCIFNKLSEDVQNILKNQMSERNFEKTCLNIRNKE